MSHFAKFNCLKFGSEFVFSHTFITKQGTRVSWLAQNSFDAFGKGVQLVSGSYCAETERLLTISNETYRRGSEKAIASISIASPSFVSV